MENRANKKTLIQYTLFLLKVFVAWQAYNRLQYSQVFFVNAFYFFILYLFYKSAFFLYVFACLYLFLTKKYEKIAVVNTLIFVLFNLWYFTFVFFHLGFFLQLLNNRFTDELGERTPFIVWNYLAGLVIFHTNWFVSAGKRAFEFCWRVLHRKIKQ